MKPAFHPSLKKLVRQLRLVAFDFDGVFTDNRVYIDQTGRESVACWRSDGIGLSRLRAAGLDMVVISTETNPVVSARCKKINMPCHQGIDNKLDTLKKIIARKRISLQQVAFVGNDINDASCLGEVGLPIIVADAHASVHSLAKWQTLAPGGMGAVREICDTIAQIHESI